LDFLSKTGQAKNKTGFVVQYLFLHFNFVIQVSVNMLELDCVSIRNNINWLCKTNLAIDRLFSGTPS
jgi:hypothetical protein